MNKQDLIIHLLIGIGALFLIGLLILDTMDIFSFKSEARIVCAKQALNYLKADRDSRTVECYRGEGSRLDYTKWIKLNDNWYLVESLEGDFQ